MLEYGLHTVLQINGIKFSTQESKPTSAESDLNGNLKIVQGLTGAT